MLALVHERQNRPKKDLTSIFRSRVCPLPNDSGLIKYPSCTATVLVGLITDLPVKPLETPSPSAAKRPD
jgi:hypothetical protein